MLDDILFTFDKNFSRIDKLLKLYKTHLAVNDIGSRGDVLRAIVVLTHSTLEDFLRNILRWKLPSCTPEILNKVTLAGKMRKTKLEFKDILDFRGSTVDEVVQKSINEYLSMVSFNNSSNITSHLNNIGIDLEPLETYLGKLDTMIKRRHNIVHKADRTNDEDISKTRIKTITLKQVESWITNVDNFVTDLSIQLRV